MQHRLAYLAAHPIYTLRRIAYRAYEALHPNEPWIAQGAVRFCDRRLNREMRAVGNRKRPQHGLVCEAGRPSVER